MGAFRFKKFSLQHEQSTMKIGTDAVLLAALTEAGDAQSLLDIGCGCGVIAFCMAQKLAARTADAVIYGVDPDEQSVLEAQSNADAFPLLSKEKFHFVRSTVQDFVRIAPAHSFDLIVSNPPFFGNDLKPTQSSRLKSKHRDEQLPFSNLLDAVFELLKPTGRFSIILPKTEGEEFNALAMQHGLFCKHRISIQPTALKPVHRVVQEYVLESVSDCMEQLLVIRGADNNYTDEYRQATKAFML